MYRSTLIPSSSRPDLPATLAATINSFEISLRAARRSPNTRGIYIRAAIKFAVWAAAHENITDLADVTKLHIELYLVWLSEVPRDNGDLYADGYVNNQYRALQQLFRWYCEEEEVANPFAKLSPPKISRKLVPVIDDEILIALIRGCERRKDYESRRDAALIRLFAATGIRLSELTNLSTDDIDLVKYTARVLGKGGKWRLVKFDAKTAQALSRYLRIRSEHKHAANPRLWLGIKNRQPMTPNGIRQVIERRGLALGVHLHPHMFRHNFTHRWLVAGGAEGDLMELNGWDSPAMLRHYGRSAAGLRARRAYDRINIMGDI